MASINVGITTATIATALLSELRHMDVDTIRKEGRCCEVLRTIQNDATNLYLRHHSEPNTSIQTEERVDTPEAYLITESNMETLGNIRSRLNAQERLDYDRRRTLAVLLETIIEVARMNPYLPNAESEAST